jgi:hypothetical protein
MSLRRVSNTLALYSQIVFQLKLEIPTLFPSSQHMIWSGFRDASKLNKLLCMRAGRYISSQLIMLSSLNTVQSHSLTGLKDCPIHIICPILFCWRYINITSNACFVLIYVKFSYLYSDVLGLLWLHIVLARLIIRECILHATSCLWYKWSKGWCHNYG